MIVEVIALLFEILFLYTGVAKLMDYYTFESQLAESPVFRTCCSDYCYRIADYGNYCCDYFVYSKMAVVGLNISAVLMVTFTLYIAIILMFSTRAAL